ncbi:MAG: hypothetical protein IH582_14460, partial [Afipia sp.]|nr:hypothetical protein [Afipia sp.]
MFSDLTLWKLPTSQYVLSSSLLILGLVLGLIYWYMARTLGRRRIARSRWSGEVVLLRAFGGVPVLWFFIVGVYAGARAIPLRGEIHQALAAAVMVVVVLSATLVAARVAGG